MLSDTGVLPAEGVAKARRAYGDSVVPDLGKARMHVLRRPGRLKACIEAMGMRLPVAKARRRIERLARVN